MNYFDAFHSSLTLPERCEILGCAGQTTLPVGAVRKCDTRTGTSPEQSSGPNRSIRTESSKAPDLHNDETVGDIPESDGNILFHRFGALMQVMQRQRKSFAKRWPQPKC
ncbi:MAG TPA: hypothetical protein VE092_06855 [Herbaspirillum sp.]|uniref:hypothetical protein n=1 Tax=Herbaspirillum sp. TaxID=1890675 RepID=UPI002D55FCA9|nr:hypothetical protein [Herbaspirillum sp.]HZG19723.1 hypothetical protein [Herbaspirillum sp.]